MKYLLPILLFVMPLAAQVTVTSPTSSFTQVKQADGTPLLDFLDDQQTGQGADDFTVNGFFMAYQAINGVQNQIVRMQLNVFDSRGFRGNLRLGIDADGDGDIDLFYGVTNQGSSAGIFFQNPGTGLNVSPSTTSLNPSYGQIALTATNYNYAVSDTVSGDAMLTFAIPFSTVQANLAANGVQVTSSTFLRFIAFTATQENSINQDMYGVQGISGATRFDSFGGGFTEFQNFDGQTPVVPEPSTYGMILIGTIMTFFSLRKLKTTSCKNTPLKKTALSSCS